MTREKIYDAALSKVAFADTSKKELYKKLCMKFAGQKELCASVCDEFEERGYINDKKYAVQKAKYLCEYKRYGPGRIREYLYQKGVAKTDIEEALEEISGEADGPENMRALLERKFRSGIDKSDRKELMKAISFLSRSGYSYAQAKEAVTEFAEDQEE